jgi:hypothetical protein
MPREAATQEHAPFLRKHPWALVTVGSIGTITMRAEPWRSWESEGARLKSILRLLVAGKSGRLI